MRVAGQRQCPVVSVCRVRVYVCLGLCVSLLMGAWNRSKARRPMVHRSTLRSLPLCSTLSPSIVFTLCGVFVSIMDACMYDSSQLVAHPSVPTATFIPASEPSVHQSLSPSVLLRRETDTQRRWPQDLEGLKMVPRQGQNAECTHAHLEGNKHAPTYT